ncbi:ABC transporter ATP-binding protein [Desulfurivibrio sp. D14AmB]|uniref:ABC transporter ATP-binding protein n=1 Tax=Desulfurivibrio sp. D14AmB TaxID=3374370 RepID=UPI00376F2A06
MLIELEKVEKIYNRGRANQVRALTEVDLLVVAGEVVCLRGPSGSGKSTLLAIIGCVIPPTSGRAAIAGKQLARLPDRFLTIHRRESIGFIFQRFNLLPTLTVLENVTLPLLPLGIGPRERRQRARRLLERLGIAHRENFPAGQISGGELQRTAIARALINNQPIILADEPTAHLDTRLSHEFMAIMAELKAEGKTIVITSHDPLVAEDSVIDRVVEVADGRVRCC